MTGVVIIVAVYVAFGVLVLLAQNRQKLRKSRLLSEDAGNQKADKGA